MKNKLSKVEQIGLAILDDIRTGIYRTGDELPSIRELCLRYSMSKQTVSLALAELARRGMLNVSHGRATRITGHPEARRIELIYTGKTSIECEEFWKESYEGIKEELSGFNEYELGVIQLGTEAERAYEERLRSPRTCGIIVMGPMTYDAIWKIQQERNLPTVRIYDHDGGDGPESSQYSKSSLVSSDFHQAITRIIKLLKAQGRHRIAYFGVGLESQYYRIDQFKLACFKRVMAENAMAFDPQLLLNLNHIGMAGSYELFAELLRQRRSRRPDALLLSSDILAPGVYRAAFDAGMGIPQDMSVAGFDNLLIGKLLIPSLTTVDQNRFLMGKTAVRRLIDILTGKNGATTELIPSGLIYRESLSEAMLPKKSHRRSPAEYLSVTTS